jgi:predicted dehydrogenase
VGQVSVDWSDPSVRKMTTKLSVWGEHGKLYVDRTELQLFLTDKAKAPTGYRRGWTVRHITDLTPPVSFYLRGEEYSAQLEAFGAAIARQEPQRNDFASAAATDLTIEMIRGAAEGGPSAAFQSETQPRRGSLVARMLGR